MPHYPRFSSREFSRRYSSAERMMEKNAIDFLLVYGDLASQADIFYLTNYLPRTACYVILPRSGDARLLVGFYNHIPNASAMSVARHIQWAGASPAKTLSRIIRSITTSPVAIGISGRIPHQDLSLMRREFSDARFTDVTSDLKHIRQIKSSEELQWLRKGAAFTDDAIESLAKNIRPGIKEYELAQLVESSYLRKGGQTRMHYVSSTSMLKPDRSVPWQYLSTRRIRQGDIVLTEISASYWGYSGQIHRPISVGQSPSEKYEELFDVAVETYESVANALRSGATEKDVLSSSSIIEESGLGICDSLVHGFGVDLLPPVLGTRSSVYSPPESFIFKRNMAMVIQPNPVTADGKMGVQVGNLTIITDRGAKSLQKYPMEFIVSD